MAPQIAIFYPNLMQSVNTDFHIIGHLKYILTYYY